MDTIKIITNSLNNKILNLKSYNVREARLKLFFISIYFIYGQKSFRQTPPPNPSQDNFDSRL